MLLCAALLFPGCSGEGSGQLTLYGVNTGKSDCLLFLLPKGETLLVDTGLKDTYDRLEAVLELAGVKEIDHLVITHGHKDHIGGLKKLAKDYAIGTIYTNAYDTATYNDAERETILEACRQWRQISPPLRGTDGLELGGVHLDFLAPDRPYSDEEDDNNNSLVLRLVYGEVAFLLMGDATTVIEESLLSQGEEMTSLLPAAFLKVGRHGKEDASLPAFIAAVHPSQAYLTGNREEDEDSPSPAVLARLEEAGAQTYSNEGEHLAVRWQSDGASLSPGEYVYE